MAKLISGINDLATISPLIAAEWDYELNTPLTPQDITSGSNKKVSWKCSEYGHPWVAAIKSRVSQGSSCSTCSGRKVLAGFNDLATIAPIGRY